MAKKPWGGRFPQEIDKLTEEFTASISFDKRLYRCDIKGSMAYAEALAKAGVISPDEKAQILRGLKEIEGEIEAGTLPFSASTEDIHMHIEQRLIEKIGDVGENSTPAGAAMTRLPSTCASLCKEEAAAIIALLQGLQTSLVGWADKHLNAIMPGYTHLRKAQPILLSHHVMAYYEMFKRDHERLLDALKRMDFLPLGSGALAGTPYPVDRTYLAELLGFAAISQNSIDAVSDRDFVAEFLFVLQPHHDAPEPTLRGTHPVVRTGVRIPAPPAGLLHRQQHHAPKGEPRRAGADQGKDRQGLRRPDHHAHGAQGPALGV